jgi:hypothetical protein
MNHDEKGPMENLLEGLDLHTDFLSLDELKAELRGRGIDIDSFLKKVGQVIAASQKANRLSWMRVADKKKNALDSIKSEAIWAEKGEEEIRAAFAAFIESPERECALAFRNKGKLTVKDMARILDATQRLRSLTSEQRSP